MQRISFMCKLKEILEIRYSKEHIIKRLFAFNKVVP